MDAANPLLGVTLPGDAYILIVEDRVDNYVTTAKLLIAAGAHPDHFGFWSSGVGIVQLMESWPRLDVILLDIGLPGIDGYSVLRQLRSTVACRKTRIVAVTGYASPEEMQKAQQVGFDGFLGKPLDALRFPQQLIYILQGKPVWEWR